MCVVLGIEPRALSRLGKLSANQVIYPALQFCFLNPLTIPGEVVDVWEPLEWADCLSQSCHKGWPGCAGCYELSDYIDHACIMEEEPVGCTKPGQHLCPGSSLSIGAVWRWSPVPLACTLQLPSWAQGSALPDLLLPGPTDYLSFLCSV